MAEQVYERILEHVQSLAQEPAAPNKVRLFEEAELVLPNYLQGSQELLDKRVLLMRHLATDVQDFRRADRTPSVNLLIRLFDGWTWQQVSEFGTGNVPYKDGLGVGTEAGEMAPFNRLMICLLEKATASASDAAHAAGMLETMQALVRLWLCTHDTGVATSASNLLLNLLEVDKVMPNEGSRSSDWRARPTGQGLVWKRIFGDRNVYNVFFETCDLGGKCDLSKNQKTIAQARLLEWLPKVGAMNWTAITCSHHPEVENKYGVKGGLLDFAALKMVDFKDDVLMHRCLIDFCSNVLFSTRPMDTHSMLQQDSVGLQYLIMHGLHARTAAIYLQLPGARQDQMDSMFLYGPAAHYLATYAASYPDHFLASQMPQQVLNRLQLVLDMSPSKWAHSDSPKHDLHLLSSVPRKSLFPARSGATSNPLLLLPSSSTNSDVLNTLACIFRGPERRAVTFPPPQTATADAQQHRDAEEAAAARALYYHYLANNPRFWLDITTHADTVALKDLALAALNCLTSVIIANWASTTETTDVFDLPCSIACADSGHIAILTPPALEYTLPYLFSPPKTFANLVGGRGDAESSVFKVANAKYDALRTLYSKLETQVEQTPGQGYEDILATIGRKLAEGPLSRDGEIGGRIGTLEL
ncbi:hypothetical protein EJ03DRAFT_30934 [Teratosphaeria nubilosa]|uniref:Uncharacterized protein n=1 Tax=Teratosphaeria nubilosa TaxID=161662 RepID=A0A6G1LF07_9PEZI|nr:hypothetical protein EJ03DRAFT_30934 [Teratosphaeria nubilosa]